MAGFRLRHISGRRLHTTRTPVPCFAARNDLCKQVRALGLLVEAGKLLKREIESPGLHAAFKPTLIAKESAQLLEDPSLFSSSELPVPIARRSLLGNSSCCRTHIAPGTSGCAQQNERVLRRRAADPKMVMLGASSVSKLDEMVKKPLAADAVRVLPRSSENRKLSD